jgi:hypothetical protein
MMVMRQSGGEVIFLGSSFLVHPDGYLITTARILTEAGDLVVVPPELEIHMPKGILGDPEEDPRGAMLMSLGVPFGYYRFHGVVAVQSVLSGRINSSAGRRKW